MEISKTPKKLSTPAITHSIDYEEIPVFEKDIEEILYSNKKVKHFIQKYQYHGLTPDFGDTVIPSKFSFFLTGWLSCYSRYRGV